MELEDVVEKLQKQKRLEKKIRRKKERDEKERSKEQRKKLMKFTSSQKWKLDELEKKQMWKVFIARKKSYYSYPRGVVYLSCIPHGFFEEQMASYFSQFGKVTGIYMPRAPSGRTRGYAFIEFQLEVIAKIVADTMNNYLFYQRILKAQYVPPEKQKPYMFAFPFGEKRLKSHRIEEMRKRRDTSIMDEKDVDNYKRKIQSKMEKLQTKMKAMGGDYSIQVSGDAPPPLPPKEETPEKVTKKKAVLKKEKKEEGEEKLQEKEEEEKSQEKEETLFDPKLTKEIRKNIALKLAAPLSKGSNKEESVLYRDADDSCSDDDDFETAESDNYISINNDDDDDEEEDSFGFGFSSDDDDAAEGGGDDDDDDAAESDAETGGSPPKMLKLTKDASTPATKSNTKLKKKSLIAAVTSSKKSPGNAAPQLKKKSIPPPAFDDKMVLSANKKSRKSVDTVQVRDNTSSPAKVRSFGTPKGNQTPKVVRDTPPKGKKKLLKSLDANVTSSTPVQSVSVKKIKKSPLSTPRVSDVKTKTPKSVKKEQNKSIIVTPLAQGKKSPLQVKSAKKEQNKSLVVTPLGQAKKSTQIKSAKKSAVSVSTPKSILKSADVTNKGASASAVKSAGKVKDVAMKRKSMSDLKGSVKNSEKKRKSLK